MLLAGAVGFVFAWTKSLPVSVGKPELRIVTHGIETIVLVPLVLWFGSKWDATGAAAAVLISTCVFAVAWLVALFRLYRAHTAREGDAVNVLVVSGIWPPDVGGPASHAPELADWLVDRGHRVEVVTTADAQPAARRYPVRWISRRMTTVARCAWGSALVARASANADVVYSTGLYRPDPRRHALHRQAARAEADGRPGLRARGALRADRARTRRLPARARRPGRGL